MQEHLIGESGRLRSYPSVFALGHKAIESLLTGPVVVQEKVDGSQFSFALTGDGLLMRSKGQTVYPENAQMFDKAVAAAQAVADKLVTGWVYRAEYLMKPKHNTLLYGRVPQNNLALYDVETGLAEFAPAAQVADEAARLGLDVVPTFYEGEVTDLDTLKGFLSRESFLGGGLVEGVVIKNYTLFTADKKVAMGKLVSADFLERHSKEWRKSNPTQGDIVDQLIVEYRTEARWRKAIQHMAERGELQNAPQDIGALLKEVGIDVRKEETEAISAALFKAFWPRIQRGITAGLPEWYKTQLAEAAFEEAS